MLYCDLTELGYKMNYFDLLAAIGRVQLRRQGEFQSRRREIAQRYVELLSDLPEPVRFQAEIADDRHARHLFPVVLPIQELCQSRDEFVRRLRERNVGASIHYAPLHKMQLYRAGRRANLATTNQLARSILTLPISASMEMDQATQVAGAFKEVFTACLAPSHREPAYALS
jgi:perosamine synthetase